MESLPVPPLDDPWVWAAELDWRKPRYHPVYDGDTVRFKLFRTTDLGFYHYSTHVVYEKFRLRRINTPELRSGDPLERERAIKARDRLREMLVLVPALGEAGVTLEIIVRSHKRRGKYRWLADIWARTSWNDDWIDVNYALVQEGLAVPYR